VLPHRYRGDKDKDHYKGINAGLIDVLYDNSTGRYALNFTIIDFRGEAVMAKAVNLNLQQEWMQYNRSNADFQFDCYPVREPLPEWKFREFWHKIFVFLVKDSLIIIFSYRVYLC